MGQYGHHPGKDCSRNVNGILKADVMSKVTSNSGSSMQKYSKEVEVDHDNSSQELDGESSPNSNLWPEAEDIPYCEPYSVHIQDRYIENETLGEGAFGTVVRGLCRFSGEEVALKTISGRGNCGGDVYSVPKPAFREVRLLMH